MVIIWCFIISYDVHLAYCAYTIVVCSVFIIMLRVLYFIKKTQQNVIAFIIVLGVPIRAVAFESELEINGFAEKLVIFFMIRVHRLIFPISRVCKWNNLCSPTFVFTDQRLQGSSQRLFRLWSCKSTKDLWKSCGNVFWKYKYNMRTCDHMIKATVDLVSGNQST